MIAKVCILLAVFAAAHAVGVAGPYGLGAGHYGLGAGHYGAFSAGTAINHVAPVAPLGYAGAYGYGAYGHGFAGAPYGYGHGYAGAPLAYGYLGARHGGLLGLKY